MCTHSRNPAAGKHLRDARNILPGSQHKEYHIRRWNATVRFVKNCAPKLWDITKRYTEQYASIFTGSWKIEVVLVVVDKKEGVKLCKT